MVWRSYCRRPAPSAPASPSDEQKQQLAQAPRPPGGSFRVPAASSAVPASTSATVGPTSGGDGGRSFVLGSVGASALGSVHQRLLPIVDQVMPSVLAERSVLPHVKLAVVVRELLVQLRSSLSGAAVSKSRPSAGARAARSRDVCANRLSHFSIRYHERDRRRPASGPSTAACHDAVREPCRDRPLARARCRPWDRSTARCHRSG